MTTPTTPTIALILPVGPATRWLRLSLHPTTGQRQSQYLIHYDDPEAASLWSDRRETWLHHEASGWRRRFVPVVDAAFEELEREHNQP